MVTNSKRITMAQSLARAGDYRGAEILLKKVRPDSDQVQRDVDFELAHVWFLQGKFNQAISLLIAAELLEDEEFVYYDAHLLYSQCLYESEQYELAISQLLRCQEILEEFQDPDPHDFFTVYAMLGHCRYEQQKFTGALEYYQMASKYCRAPEDWVQFYEYRAGVYNSTKDYPNAIKDCFRGLRLARENELSLNFTTELWSQLYDTLVAENRHRLAEEIRIVVKNTIPSDLPDGPHIRWDWHNLLEAKSDPMEEGIHRELEYLNPNQEIIRNSRNQKVQDGKNTTPY